MNSNSPRDPLITLRKTIISLDSAPEPLTPQLEPLRQLLENRLRRLEDESARKPSGSSRGK